jgi:hypothetical protein
MFTKVEMDKQFHAFGRVDFACATNKHYGQWCIK